MKKLLLLICGLLSLHYVEAGRHGSQAATKVAEKECMCGKCKEHTREALLTPLSRSQRIPFHQAIVATPNDFKGLLFTSGLWINDDLAMKVINSADTKGETPLMTAARLNLLPIVVWLLLHDVDQSAKNSKGQTAFDLACGKSKKLLACKVTKDELLSIGDELAADKIAVLDTLSAIKQNKLLCSGQPELLQAAFLAIHNKLPLLQEDLLRSADIEPFLITADGIEDVDDYSKDIASYRQEISSFVADLSEYDSVDYPLAILPLKS